MRALGKCIIISLLIVAIVFMGCTGNDEKLNDNENNNGNGDGDMDGNGNVSPHASMWFPRSAVVGQSVKFDASNSSDPDGEIVEFFWDFGDGSNDTGKIVYHTYEIASYMGVSLRVTDDDGYVDFTSDSISITEDGTNGTQLTAPEADLSCRKIEKIPGIVKYFITVSNVTGDNTEIVNMNYSIIDGGSNEILLNGSLTEATQSSDNGVAFATFDYYLSDGDLFTISPETIPGLDDGDIFRIDFIPNGDVVGACLLGTDGL